MGILASLVFLASVAVGGFFIYNSVAVCSACEQAGGLPGLEEETTTLA
jgi:hypothetical protein